MFLALLAGTALVFGDGALTPAISVLSATEGVESVSPGDAHLAVPTAVVILVVLFAVQSRGTHSIGRVFGPVMVIWFLAIAGLGVYHVAQNPMCCEPSPRRWPLATSSDMAGMRSPCLARSS